MEKYAKQGELMLKGTGAGNELAAQVSKTRVIDF
jgi:hypothetical protein